MSKCSVQKTVLSSPLTCLWSVCQSRNAEMGTCKYSQAYDTALAAYEQGSLQPDGVCVCAFRHPWHSDEWKQDHNDCSPSVRDSIALKYLCIRSNMLCPYPHCPAFFDITVAGSWAGSPTNMSLDEPYVSGISTSSSQHWEAWRSGLRWGRTSEWQREDSLRQQWCTQNAFCFPWN